MRVLNIPGGADTGGQGWRIKDAFERLAPDWTYDLCTSSRKYMRYPEHRPWHEAKDLWRDADVVHLRNDFSVERRLRSGRRPAVIHHHGTLFRSNPERLLAETRSRPGTIGLAATLDLWLIAPDELEWLPAAYDMEWLASFRRPVDDGVLRIAHAPTDRKIKSTDAFLAAVEKLRKDIPVELELIEHASWADSLNRRSRADIFFDQVLLGYGNNSIEAWGMGIPVIAGAQPPTLDEMTRRFGDLPFYLADEGSIYDALTALAEPETRAAWAKRGLEHARRWHDEGAVVTQLRDVYTRAAG